MFGNVNSELGTPEQRKVAAQSSNIPRFRGRATGPGSSVGASLDADRLKTASGLVAAVRGDADRRQLPTTRRARASLVGSRPRCSLPGTGSRRAWKSSWRRWTPTSAGTTRFGSRVHWAFAGPRSTVGAWASPHNQSKFLSASPAAQNSFGADSRRGGTSRRRNFRRFGRIPPGCEAGARATPTEQCRIAALPAAGLQR